MQSTGRGPVGSYRSLWALHRSSHVARARRSVFTTVLQVLVLGTIIAQSIVCVVVQSVTVGMTKVEKLSLVHVEVNIGSNEKENVTVVARLCSLAKRRDSVMYCPGKPLLSRAWLRDGGVGFELGMDEQDIADMIKERTGYVNFRGLEHLHESAFAEIEVCTKIYRKSQFEHW